MPFPHRINSDGTVDSICDQCFATIGTSAHESDLQALESTHICEPARVAYYHHLNLTSKRPPAKNRELQSARKLHANNRR